MSTKYESERTVYTRDQILALRAHGSQLSQCARTIVEGLITTRRTIRGCRGGHHRRPPPVYTASGFTGGIIVSGNRPANPYDRNQYPNKEHEILRHRGSRKGARKIRQPVRFLPGGSVELRWSARPPRYLVSVPSRQVRPDRRRESELPGILNRLHHTADGLDGLPAWFLRLAAPAFAYPLAYLVNLTNLVNLSINSAIIPEQWKTAIIRPVAKVPHPVEPSDDRPIHVSVVPVLSRMVERLVVQTYIYPAFEDDAMRCNLQDQ